MSLGALVLSFDFELAWGMRDRLDGSQRLDHFSRVSDEIVPALLELLARYEITATWATVGHLMLRGEDRPAGGQLHPGANFQLAGLSDTDLAAFYAPHAIEAILKCPAPQELAAHSFSHPLFVETTCPAALASEELAHVRHAAAQWGQNPTSFVFPRNAIGHLPALRAAGYRAFRGANAEWYWFGRPWTIYSRRWLRMPVWTLRYVDEQLAFTPPLPAIRRTCGMWEIPHSMFFPGRRGVSRWVHPARQATRAIKGLNRAAEQGRIFSMFTHPHNFGDGTESLLVALGTICQHAARLRDAQRLSILSMNQVADELDAGRGETWLAE